MKYIKKTEVTNAQSSSLPQVRQRSYMTSPICGLEKEMMQLNRKKPTDLENEFMAVWGGGGGQGRDS